MEHLKTNTDHFHCKTDSIPFHKPVMSKQYTNYALFRMFKKFLFCEIKCMRLNQVCFFLFKSKLNISTDFGGKFKFITK